MAEDQIQSLRRSIEALKNKKKKLQDSYTEEGEQLRRFEEKEAQIQEFIRELNNKNKELQKQLDARKAAQSTRNSFFDRQHQETLEKLDNQHKKILEKKADLYSREKRGPNELQQLEEKYSKILKEKHDILMKQQKTFKLEEQNLKREMENHAKQVSQIISEASKYVPSEEDSNDSNDLFDDAEFLRGGKNNIQQMCADSDFNFPLYPKETFSHDIDILDTEDEEDMMENKQTSQLIECFKNQITFTQKKDAIRKHINTLKNMKQTFEVEILALKKELQSKNQAKDNEPEEEEAGKPPQEK